MPDVDEDTLNELAEKLLNEEGQERVMMHLIEGKVRLAQTYLLGALDNEMKHGDLTEDEASTMLSQIGLPMAEVERIRTVNAPKYE